MTEQGASSADTIVSSGKEPSRHGNIKHNQKVIAHRGALRAGGAGRFVCDIAARRYGLPSLKWVISALVVMAVALFFSRSLLDSVLARIDRERAVHRDATAVESGVQAQVRPKVLLVYRNENGKRVRVLADEARFSQFVRAQVRELEKSREVLRFQAKGALFTNTSPAFSAMRGRVVKFADWYFGWTTTYELMGKAIAASISNVLRPGVMELGEAVRYELEQYIEQHYQGIVLRPEQSDPVLRQAYRATLDDLYEDFTRSLAALEEDLQVFIASHTTYLSHSADVREVRMSLDWDSQSKKLYVASHERGFTRPVAGIALVSGGALVGRAAGTAAGKILVGTSRRRTVGSGMRSASARLAAPYVTRLGTTAASAFTGAILGPSGALFGALAGMGGDYLLNEAVEMVRRDEFESEVQATLDAQERDWQAIMQPSLEAAVDTWFNDIIQLLVVYVTAQ